MIYKIIFHEEAQEDYEKSLQYYLTNSITTAHNFVEAIDGALKLICEHPLRWRNIYKNFYELSIRKFPFTLFI